MSEIMEGRLEGKRKAKAAAHGLDDRGRIRETKRLGTTTGGLESIDIRTCWKTDNLKKKTQRHLVPVSFPDSGMSAWSS